MVVVVKFALKRLVAPHILQLTFQKRRRTTAIEIILKEVYKNIFTLNVPILAPTNGKLTKKSVSKRGTIDGQIG